MPDELKLYELTDAVTKAIDEGYYADEETGEILFDSTDVDALAVRIEDKLAGCCNVVERYESYIARCDAEIKRIQELKKGYKGKAERLKGYMLRNVKKLDGRVELPTHRLSVARCAPKVDILDMDALPDEFKRITVEPDKRAIAAAIKDGHDVPGAALVSNERLVLK